ncbi:TRAP transporter substrate-binding protein [Brevibacillus sp. H7]|uniref:TRAP transporter substrate-binding protein n=1 Tax=Brevibacillus sp. H7 TaxID=3349138 RepID=UPI00381C5F5E
MVKRIVTLLLVLAVALTTAACGGGKENAGTGAGGGAAQEPVKLKLGHIAGENDAWHKGALKFAELVKQKTNGSVEVEVFPSSTLGNDRDLIEGMQMGSVDFALVAGVLSNFYEPYSILELPYLFRDKEHLEKVLYGPVGDELKAELLENAKLRGLQFWMRGPRELTANKKVEKLEDLKGIKIRVPEIPASIAAWKAMGATPTPMAFGEVYSSLQTGVIDAQENPRALIDSAKLNEVQKYLMKTDHVFGYVLLTMSDLTYNKLTPEQQKAVEEAAKEATEYENKLVFELEDQLLKKLKDSGMEFVELDTKPFVEAVQPVHKEFAEKYGKELYEKIVNTK